VVEQAAIYLVYEFLPYTLRDFLGTLRSPLKPTVVRDYARQLCLALQYCHEHGVLHRDVRPDSVRMSQNNRKLVLSDFKFAKALCPPVQNMTADVGGEGTLWYRAPEMLMGSTTYSTPVDVWALGTTIAEIASNRPLFPGITLVDQLIKLFQCRGTPREANWQGVSTLPHYLPVCPEWSALCLSKFLPESVLESTGLALLEGMLTMDPSRRLLLADARQHPYLKTVHEGLVGQSESTVPMPVPTSPASGTAAKSSISVSAMSSSAAVPNGISADTGCATACDDEGGEKATSRKRRKKI